MKVTMIQHVCTPEDYVYTASGVTGGTVECCNAVAAARDLDKLGERSEYAQALAPRRAGCKLAVGHGVTVIYADGKKRHVRAA